MNIIYFIYFSLSLAYTTSNIIKGNDLNLQKLISTPGKFSFVDFYADWCRHCKKISPIFDQLSELYKEYPEIQFIKINGDTDGTLMSKKYVDVGYPTLLFFYPDGRKVEFEGSRDLDTFSNFIQQLSGIRLVKKEEVIEVDPQTQFSNKLVHLSPDTFYSQIENHEYSIVSIGASWCQFCQEFKPSVESLASVVYNRDSNILIGQYIIDEFDDRSIDAKYDVKRLPTLLFFNRDVENPLIYKGDYKNYQSILNAINEYTKLNRDAEGNLKPNAGIDLNIVNMIKENEADVVSKIDDEYYIKLLSGDSKFLPIELNRIESILKNDRDKINGELIDSLTKRANIIRSLIDLI